MDLIAQLAREFGVESAERLMTIFALATFFAALTVLLRAAAFVIRTWGEARLKQTEAEVAHQNAETSTRNRMDEIVVTQLEERKQRDKEKDEMNRRFTEQAVQLAKLQGAHEVSEKHFAIIQDNLKRQLDVTEAAWKSAESRNKKNEDQIDDLRKEVAALRADLVKANDNATRTSAENATLRGENTRLEEENKLLLQRIEELEARLKNAETENANLKGEVGQLRTRIDELQAHMKQETPPEPIAQALALTQPALS